MKESLVLDRNYVQVSNFIIDSKVNCHYFDFLVLIFIESDFISYVADVSPCLKWDMIIKFTFITQVKAR